jgi:hypothetical protein
LLMLQLHLPLQLLLHFLVIGGPRGLSLSLSWGMGMGMGLGLGRLHNSLLLLQLRRRYKRKPAEPIKPTKPTATPDSLQRVNDSFIGMCSRRSSSRSSGSCRNDSSSSSFSRDCGSSPLAPIQFQSCSWIMWQLRWMSSRVATASGGVACGDR